MDKESGRKKQRGVFSFWVKRFFRPVASFWYSVRIVTVQIAENDWCLVDAGRREWHGQDGDAT
jgi:hypothetical protein